MARGGAAIVLEDADVDAGLLAPVVLDLLRDRRRRRELAAAARRLARPHAAALIVDRLLALAGRPAQDTRREGVAAL
jgi:UDP-N-acetylglucosamine:LPS N-acetylglucosamine transferase